MKALRFYLLVLVALAFAPSSASAITVFMPPELPGFHVVFSSGTMLGYITAEMPPGSVAGSFDVTPFVPYQVWKAVSGVGTLIGTVVWDGGGIPTYTPN